MQDTNKQYLPPQNLPSGLWVVATPIGNVADLSPRAHKALEEADWILCEDTRRTGTLMAALGISSSGRLKRLDAHTTDREIRGWVETLKKGKTCALVTDAGTPAVSDPGSKIVAQVLAEGIRVTPIPGPSAVVTLLSASSFNQTAFTFRGFFPRKRQEKEQELRSVSASTASRVFIWFESPNRIEETLTVLGELFPESRVAVGKELTKIHETLFHGSAVEVAQAVTQEIQTEGPLGEWCFGVEFQEQSEEQAQDESLDKFWISALKCLKETGVSASAASKAVSHEFGISKKTAYERALLIFGKKI